MPLQNLPYREIWAVDFEFQEPAGERPNPVCLQALELRSGRRIACWREEMHSRSTPPYGIGPESLFVSYFAVAEYCCHLALNWPLPANTLDLFAEFRVLLNGRYQQAGYSLLAAMEHHHLPHLDAGEKSGMRNLILRGGPWDAQQQQAILEYCYSDVEALSRLLPAMLSKIDMPRALLRGRYMKAVAAMQHTGTPVDCELLKRLQHNWDVIKDQLILAVNRQYELYDGRTFKAGRWAQWLNTHQIPWPYLNRDQLDLRRETFKDMAALHPFIREVKETRDLLAKARTLKPAVGTDGHNRCSLAPFRSKTGRNQPRNRHFVFAFPAWLRSLIRPKPGRALAYLDWEQQEFGIAAAMSGDERMLAAYHSGDPYLEFAKQAKAVPPNATKASHRRIRDQFKTCAIGVQYRMSEYALARRINQPLAYAQALLALHRRTYRRFWEWNDSLTDIALLSGMVHTVFGWPLHIDGYTKPNTVSNFPIQANGAEMLRVACCLATEAGIQVCAPVHDAILIEAAESEIVQAVQITQACMAVAGKMVLDGTELRSETKIIRYPDHYVDDKDNGMFERVMEIVARAERGEIQPARWRTRPRPPVDVRSILFSFSSSRGSRHGQHTEQV